MKICIAQDRDRFEYGIFYIESNNVHFPYSGWEDFYLSFIVYWIQKLIANNNVLNSFDVAFMEGEYCLKIQRCESQVLVTGIKEETPSFENNFSETLLYSELKHLLYSVAQNIIQKAREESYRSDELEQLIDLAEMLLD